MKKYNFIVKKTEDGYSAYLENKYGIIAITGDTMNELKLNALDALNLTLDHHKQKQANDSDIGLVIDMAQFFDYYKVINTTQLAQRVHINRSLLAQYISGQKTPSPLQRTRILKEVQQIGRELSDIEFA